MHHTDVPNLDRRADITDFFVFQKPKEPSKSILITNVNFEAPTHADTFNPEASYEWKIDVNGDAQPEIAFHVLFLPTDNKQQMANVYCANGAIAQQSGAVGEVIIRNAPTSFGRETHITTTGEFRFYAGLRSDPFFADPVGLENDMQWTGQDYFADKNVFGIVLEVPNTALGSDPQIGIWAQIMLPAHGKLTPVNQMGRPGQLQSMLGTQTFNATPPAQQRALFLPQLVAKFRDFGYSEDEATKFAMEWLPDILPYNYASGEGYPNGRRLTDDVADYWWRVKTKGKVTSDLLGPHMDYLSEFPYLGPPH